MRRVRAFAQPTTPRRPRLRVHSFNSQDESGRRFELNKGVALRNVENISECTPVILRPNDAEEKCIMINAQR